MKHPTTLLPLAAFLTTLIATTHAAASTTNYPIPATLQTFYNTAKSGTCTGTDLLAGGYHDGDASDPTEWTFCQSNGVAGKAIFIKGNNKYANMDIDCDGNQAGGGAGTKCGASTDMQSETAFKDTVAGYGISDLDANVHPYVVFGHDGGSHEFDPQKHGVEPLSVMAVVCGGKLVYGIWGDTNGEDGPAVVGEASISLASACFPNDGITGNNGHAGTDVLYIAFTGADAVPGKAGAVWKAGSYGEFEASIKSIGDRMVSRVFGGGTAGAGSPTTMQMSTTKKTTGETGHAVPKNAEVLATQPKTTTCEWAGHCAEAACGRDADCSGSMTCGRLRKCVDLPAGAVE